MRDDSYVLVSYCVVNTDGRDLLLACLEAIELAAPAGLEREVLVLDNASGDGSVQAVEALGRGYRVLAMERRQGKAENDTLLLREARGRYCLLLNEDAELRPGAVQALLEALEADPQAAVAGSRLLSPAGEPQPCAWRLPGLGAALAGALLLHRWLVTQSGGEVTRRVGWVQSSAMLVRRDGAEAVGYLDPDFFVYSDETDFCKRLRDAGWEILFVPAARAVHHEQLATDAAGASRRAVEFHRNRDLYLRKHHGRVVAFAARPLLAFPYLLRALAALALPGHSPGRYLLHFRQALRPGAGEGIREAAEKLNRERESAQPPAPARTN